ncbi:hypothetical protein [Acanthopleuribacter pedis]|uniref:Transmembrane protein n=1 Tax=Acanthopleuribacter pedis TaxID=442870 RepID=A0A8J7U6C2_9BACT|nr:hypothetical protein [Acanthopleuribacter pedis]MBO1321749.1 hypothetical protein [Acanthopleuribacter pedis]
MPEGTGEMELRVDGAVEYRRHALGMILFGAVLVIGILAFPAFLNSRYGVMMFVAGIGFIGWGGIRLLEVHGDEGGSTE